MQPSPYAPLLWFLSLFLAPAPEAALPDMDGPPVVQAIPGDAWAMISLDIHALRARTPALGSALSRAAPLVREAWPEGQPRPRWLRNGEPGDRLRAWQDRTEAALAEGGLLPPGGLRDYADAIRRVHVVAHGLAGMTGVGVAVIIEGPEAARSLDLAALAFGPWTDAARGGGRMTGMALDGRDWLFMAPGGRGGMVAVSGVGRRTVLATSLPMARHIVRQLAGDLQKTAGTLAERLETWGLEGPKAAGVGQLAWGFANLPVLAPALDAIFMGMTTIGLHGWPSNLTDPQRARDAITGGVLLAAGMGLLTDTASFGPATAVFGPDGGLSLAMAMPEAGDLGRWLGGDGFRHGLILQDRQDVLAAASVGLRDGQGLAHDLAERATAALRLAGSEAGAKRLADFRQTVVLVAEEALGRTLGRIREVGCIVFAPPGDFPPPPAEDKAFGLWISRMAAVTLRLAETDEDGGGDATLDAFWKRLRPMLLWSPVINNPGLFHARAPDAFPEADEDGRRKLSLAIPDAPEDGPGIHIAAQGGQLAVAGHMDVALRALDAALAQPPAGETGFLACSVLNVPAVLRIMRDGARQAGEDSGFTHAPDALLDMAPFMSVSWRQDTQALRAEMENGAFLVVGGAAAAALGIQEEHRRTQLMVLRVHSLHNLRQCGVIVQSYMQMHDEYPPSLEALRGLGLIDPGIFDCPATGQPFFFEAGLPCPPPAGAVVMYSAPMRDGGRSILFGDGHVKSQFTPIERLLAENDRWRAGGIPVPREDVF